MGRRKGSKNKPKGGALAETINTDNLSPDNDSKREEALPPPPLKRGRGRPKGSKNKPKVQDDEREIKKDNPVLVSLFGNEKDIKKEIRSLKKLKLQCRAGSEERITLHRKIKELKDKLVEKKVGDIEKEPLIKEILELDKSFEVLGIDLNKFSVQELTSHLKKMKGDKENETNKL